MKKMSRLGANLLVGKTLPLPGNRGGVGGVMLVMEPGL